MKNSAVSFAVTAIILIGAIWYGYANYHVQIHDWLGVRTQYSIYVGESFFSVTIANDASERKQGLSGTTELPDQQGMLFVFDDSGRYGMWMKDMLYAIDIIWIDENLEVVHIEEDVRPETYPRTFSSPQVARFVLEVPAFSVETFKIQRGQKVSIPVDVLPADLQPQ